MFIYMCVGKVCTKLRVGLLNIQEFEITSFQRLQFSKFYFRKSDKMSSGNL